MIIYLFSAFPLWSQNPFPSGKINLYEKKAWNITTKTSTHSQLRDKWFWGFRKWNNLLLDGHFWSDSKPANNDLIREPETASSSVFLGTTFWVQTFSKVMAKTKTIYVRCIERLSVEIGIAYIIVCTFISESLGYIDLQHLHMFGLVLFYEIGKWRKHLQNSICKNLIYLLGKFET